LATRTADHDPPCGLKNLGSDDLDDASDQNIRELEIFADRIIHEPKSQEALEQIADLAYSQLRA
jgi:hypothetical protein